MRMPHAIFVKEFSKTGSERPLGHRFGEQLVNFELALCHPHAVLVQAQAKILPPKLHHKGGRITTDARFLCFGDQRRRDREFGGHVGACCRSCERSALGIGLQLLQKATIVQEPPAQEVPTVGLLAFSEWPERLRAMQALHPSGLQGP